MLSLSDLLNGPKVFEENFGPRWGPHLWRAFFVLVVLAIIAGCLKEIGGVGQAVYSWFYPASSVAPTDAIGPTITIPTPPE